LDGGTVGVANTKGGERRIQYGREATRLDWCVGLALRSFGRLMRPQDDSFLWARGSGECGERLMMTVEAGAFGLPKQTQ
jgi:hypothetical protein